MFHLIIKTGDSAISEYIHNIIKKISQAHQLNMVTVIENDQLEIEAEDYALILIKTGVTEFLEEQVKMKDKMEMILEQVKKAKFRKIF